METTIIYKGYIGIMEKQMETTIVYRGYIGIREKQMETTMIHEYVIFRISRSLHWAAFEELTCMSSIRKPDGLL